jgi:hypothetical protein
VIVEELLALLAAVGAGAYLAFRSYRRSRQKQDLLIEAARVLAASNAKAIDDFLILKGSMLNKELRSALEARKADLELGIIK